jgi:hypothetical protein
MDPDDLNLYFRLRRLSAEKGKPVLARLREEEDIGEPDLSVERVYKIFEQEAGLSKAHKLRDLLLRLLARAEAPDIKPPASAGRKRPMATSRRTRR